jgi:hypothetical protein
MSDDRFSIDLHAKASPAICLPKPPDMTFSEAMRVLQLWLADRRLHPCSFKITADMTGGFEVSFTSERDVLALEEFQWPP